VVPVAPGFRLRAPTPANRLKFESHPLRHFLGVIQMGVTQDPGSQAEPGAPSASLYFPETYRSAFLSATHMPTNFGSSTRATRPSMYSFPDLKGILESPHSCYLGDNSGVPVPMFLVTRLTRSWQLWRLGLRRECYVDGSLRLIRLAIERARLKLPLQDGVFRSLS